MIDVNNDWYKTVLDIISGDCIIEIKATEFDEGAYDHLIPDNIN